MVFLKKLIKNKVLVLCVSVIVVSLVYTGVQKAIDNYNFNNDIISSEVGNGVEEKNEGLSFDEKDDNSMNEEISDEETELVLEEAEEEAIVTEEADSEEYNETDAISKIYVYITGEVNNPGVVVLNEGSRIVDAINAAGGTTVKANVSKVNLVYVLNDGMKVNIPNDNELKNNSNFEYITMNSGDGGNDYYSGGESSSGISSGTGTVTDNGGGIKKYDIVNINTATQTELESLPGIGPSLALKIINYRKENGKFSSIEQIKDVSGIGESKFESLKSYITI